MYRFNVNAQFPLIYCNTATLSGDGVVNELQTA